jgi:hypothetical protein
VPVRWEIHEAEATVVRRIFRDYVSGLFSLRSLIDSLNRDGVPTPSGSRRRKGARDQWSVSSVRKMLINDAYLGTHTWNRRSQGAFFCVIDGLVAERPKGDRDKRTYNTKDQWIRREGAHEPIIDRPTFDKAAAMLARNKDRPAASRGRRVYVFSGLMCCGNCRGRLVGKGGGAHNSRYVCSSASQKKACPSNTVNEARLLAALAEKLRSKFDAEFLDGFAEAARLELAAAAGGPSDAEVEALRQRVADLERQVLTAAARMMSVPDALYAAAEAGALALQKQHDEAKAELARLTAQVEPPADFEAMVVQARQALARLAEVLAESDPLAVRAVLREHLDRIVIHFADQRADDGGRTRFDRAGVFFLNDSPLADLCRSVRPSPAPSG